MHFFLRMPAVYGFEDDHLSPWVLNSLCKAKLRGQKVEPRHPDRIVYLAHRDPLLACIRALISGCDHHDKKLTVNYLRPPMIRLSVSTLATLVQESSSLFSSAEAEQLQIRLEEMLKWIIIILLIIWVCYLTASQNFWPAIDENTDSVAGSLVKQGISHGFRIIYSNSLVHFMLFISISVLNQFTCSTNKHVFGSEFLRFA